MVILKHDPDGSTIEKNEHCQEENPTGTGNGSMHPWVDNGAWLEMEDNIISPGEHRKIRKKPSVLLTITTEEFQHE
jgi:hypothetical protein